MKWLEVRALSGSRTRTDVAEVKRRANSPSLTSTLLLEGSAALLAGKLAQNSTEQLVSKRAKLSTVLAATSLQRSAKESCRELAPTRGCRRLATQVHSQDTLLPLPLFLMRRDPTKLTLCSEEVPTRDAVACKSSTLEEQPLAQATILLRAQPHKQPTMEQPGLQCTFLDTVMEQLAALVALRMEVLIKCRTPSHPRR